MSCSNVADVEKGHVVGGRAKCSMLLFSVLLESRLPYVASEVTTKGEEE